MDDGSHIHSRHDEKKKKKRKKKSRKFDIKTRGEITGPWIARVTHWR